MARPIKKLQAEPDVVQELRRRVNAPTSTVRQRDRASIILLRLEGVGIDVVAGKLGTTSKRVSMWARRFELHGLDGLEEKPGRGRKPSIPTQKI